MTAYSDAVVAIAITLLAIDLPVPVGHNAHEFWHQVANNDGHYASFLISFAVIAGARGAHHDLFRYVTRTDYRLRVYNTVWLLTIVLIPFATRLLTPSESESTGTRALGFGFYALLQVIESGMLLLILQHLTSHGQAPDFPRPVIQAMAWRSGSLVLAFGLSIPFFILTVNAWLIWIVVPLLIHQARQFRRRRQQTQQTTDHRETGTEHER